MIRYIIPGDPSVLVRLRTGNRREWDTAKHIRHACSVALEEQAAQPLRGPLQVEVHFYLPTASKVSKKLYGTYYTLRPNLSDFLRLFQDICGGVLFESNAAIAYLTATKRYDANPRMEIYIQELR